MRPFLLLLLGKTKVPILVPQQAFLRYLVTQEKLRFIQNPIANHLPTERRLGTND